MASRKPSVILTAAELRTKVKELKSEIADAKSDIRSLDREKRSLKATYDKNVRFLEKETKAIVDDMARAQQKIDKLTKAASA